MTGITADALAARVRQNGNRLTADQAREMLDDWCETGIVERVGVDRYRLTAAGEKLGRGLLAASTAEEAA